MKNVAINIRRNNRQKCNNKVLITRALQSLYFRQKNGTIGAVNWQLLANCLALLLFCHSIAYTLKPWITASLNNVRVKGQKMGIHHTSPNSSNISLLLHSKVCWTWRLNIEKKFETAVICLDNEQHCQRLKMGASILMIRWRNVIWSGLKIIRRRWMREGWSTSEQDEIAESVQRPSDYWWSGNGLSVTGERVAAKKDWREGKKKHQIGCRDQMKSRPTGCPWQPCRAADDDFDPRLVSLGRFVAVN